MTTTEETAGRRGAPSLDVWQVPPLDRERGLVSGVSAGLAREIGIDAAYVRVAFVVLSAAGGWGIGLYAVAWVLMRNRIGSSEEYEPTPKAASSKIRHVAFAMIVIGVLVLMTDLGASLEPALVWPVALVGAAVAVVLDRGQAERLGLAELPDDRQMQVRFVLGLTLLLAGIITGVALNFTFWQAFRTVVVAGLILTGAGLLLAPMLTGLADELLEERRRRIRSEERADLAAHLRDSVLQTLALIQKRSDDVGVVNLARRQERELRNWLFEERALHEPAGFKAQLERVMAEVEDVYEVPIEVVVVGDREAGHESEPIFMAGREAAINAARHSGASRIDVFAEVGLARVEVFVRDQGIGFDPDDVSGDRAGIRDSIRGRMERHGGDATVVSHPGDVTEVELSLPLRPGTDEVADA